MTALSLEQRLVEGNAESPVRLVVYEDLQCGDCRALRELLLLLYEARLSGMDLFFWSLGILALVAGRTLAVQFSPRRAG